ncbi:DNA (cytosine-5-)-methyltransferase [Streptobacillus felis]|uniref:Cytosine-specific methyltransferase n=1 Tax=Streptobacillus felis TaxID=1384509 RepID=A0A7Z0PF71_9FUSO|nr:DNA (cytosine-5-)-methyltransferase [Streptobacillus felis]NYV27929.1 DNA (cytosine-5-)-methyltransferase [Streptobacillus felis]
MINLATVFSGIGAIEQALIKLNIPHVIKFACDNGERHEEFEKKVDNNLLENMSIKEKLEYSNKIYECMKKPNYMEQSYKANYEIENDNFYQDIRFLDGTKYENQVDLFVGGSPCQAFSIIGKRGGFNDTRGTLFYDFARLIKEIKPKVFIFENVKGMLNHDKGKTWETIQNVFDELNYNIYNEKDYVVNSVDYNIPQNRPRIFIIGFRKDLILENKFKFPNKMKLNTKVSDFYENSVDSRFYLGQKGFEFVTNPKYKNRAQVNKDIMICQKANQQFNWNGDFVFEEFNDKKHTKEILDRAYISNYDNKIGVIRKLTPRECLRLMGFKDDFKIVVPDAHIYRQIGNSIVVNVLTEIVKSIFETGVFYDKNSNSF